MSPAKLQSLLQTALAHHRAGRLDQAAALYDQVRQAAPKLFDPVHLAGTVAYQQGRYADAVALLTRAAALDPRSAPCSLRLGLALLAQQRPEEAERHLRASLAREPSAEACNGLALAQRAQGRAVDALASWQQAVTLNPRFYEAHDQLGALLADLRGYSEALPYFRRAVEIAPSYASGWCNLGLACAQTGAMEEAFSHFDRALSLAPELHQARLGRALAHQKSHRIEAALAEYATVLSHQPENFEARSARLLCLNYLQVDHPEVLAAEHREFGRLASAAAARAPRLNPPPLPRKGPDARLRLAFLSPDLRAHSVAYFLEPILRHLDRTRFEIVLYHDHAVIDPVSARLHDLADGWRHVASQPHTVVGAQIRADAPDVLIDLAGHTGFNRLALLAQRLAPVQISYLGYPNTTGLSEMDFRLVDAVTDPAGSADALATETLVRFAPTAWVYQPPAASPAISQPAADPARPLTFGSFNNLDKLSPQTVALWARVLQAAPGAHLFLKGSGLSHEAARASVRSRFEQAGLAGDRLIFAEKTATLGEHLAAYSQVDVALDTFPYHGTTTTCEALWMGRPVVTRLGDRHASRVGASLLTAIECPQWIAESDEAYVDTAVRLLHDHAARTRWAGEARAQMAASPLLDAAAQTARFAAALRTCYEAVQTKHARPGRPTDDLRTSTHRRHVEADQPAAVV